MNCGGLDDNIRRFTPTEPSNLRTSSFNFSASSNELTLLQDHQHKNQFLVLLLLQVIDDNHLKLVVLSLMQEMIQVMQHLSKHLFYITRNTISKHSNLTVIDCRSFVILGPVINVSFKKNRSFLLSFSFNMK